MKPIYQTIVDPNKGNCMQAAIASLFEKPLENVPNFIEHGGNWHKTYLQFLTDNGYTHDYTLYNPIYVDLVNEVSISSTQYLDKDEIFKQNISNLTPSDGIDGVFFATVCSPKYFSLENKTYITHAVLVDHKLNIVHDPNRDYNSTTKYPLADEIGYNGIVNLYVIFDHYAEGNKLIAEYMGAEMRKFNKQVYAHFPNRKSPSMYNEVTFERWSNENAKYHSSFDWLIPVVKKLSDEYGDYVNPILDESLIKYDVKDLWNNVVKLIKKVQSNANLDSQNND